MDASRYWGKVPISDCLDKSKMAEWLNCQEFINTYENLYTMVLEIFKWKNLPETVDERMLERMLLLNGQAMICKASGDKLEDIVKVPGISAGGNFAYLALASAGGYDINLNGYPTKAWGYGMNGVCAPFDVFVAGAEESPILLQTPAGNVDYGTPEAVICYDNVNAFPMVGPLMSDAWRMADLVRTTDTIAATLRTPLVFGATEAEKKAIIQMLDNYENNIFAFIVSKNFNVENIKAWPVNGNPENLKAVWSQYLNIQARLLTIFGIQSNQNSDKAERLVVDEAHANDQFVYYNLQKRLTWRKKFCEAVNGLWGLNIDVEVNPEVIKYAEQYESDGMDGEDGDDDGGPREGDGDTCRDS